MTPASEKPNGKLGEERLDVNAIPMPMTKSTDTPDSAMTFKTALPPNHPNVGDEAPAILNNKTKGIHSTPSNSNKTTSSLTNLPMPPGVNIDELVDAPTPSPTYNEMDSMSPKEQKKNNNSSNRNQTGSTSSLPNNKSLLNLPMPPMVPGSEDLSGDEELINSPDEKANNSSNDAVGTPKDNKRKRPIILNRRDSRSNVRDWGERCVDVFEMVEQIGEGTYGQVSFMSDFYFMLLLLYYAICWFTFSEYFLELCVLHLQMLASEPKIHNINSLGNVS